MGVEIVPVDPAKWNGATRISVHHLSERQQMEAVVNRRFGGPPNSFILGKWALDETPAERKCREHVEANGGIWDRALKRALTEDEKKLVIEAELKKKLKIQAQLDFMNAKEKAVLDIQAQDEFYDLIMDENYLELIPENILLIGKLSKTLDSPLKQMKTELKLLRILSDYFKAKPNEFGFIDGKVYLWACYAKELCAKLLLVDPLPDLGLNQDGFNKEDPYIQKFFDRLQELEDEIEIIEQMEGSNE